jgi:hypothetical protein
MTLAFITTFVFLVVAWVISVVLEAIIPGQATTPVPITCFKDIEVKPIPKIDGWSSLNVKINERSYRWDMETEAARELEKQLNES